MKGYNHLLTHTICVWVLQHPRTGGGQVSESMAFYFSFFKKDSLKIVAGLTKYSKMIGANLAKKLYYGAAQPLVKGVVIEGTEETLVNTANRIFDIHVLKEDKNMLDG